MFKADRQTRFHPRLVLAVVVLALVLVFIIENPRETKIRFIVPQVTAPLWIALFVAAIPRCAGWRPHRSPRRRSGAPTVAGSAARHAGGA